MENARGLWDDMRAELAGHRRPLRALGAAVGLFLLAGAVAAVLGWDLVVAAIAAVGILGTAIAVLAWTAFLHA